MTRPRIVIIGGGFGGLAAAKALRTAVADVTLIDRTNHHVFQPLLYQVATAALAPSDIAAPIRWILRSHRNLDVVLGDVVGIDCAAKIVHLKNEAHPLRFDYLIIAAGSRHAYFGHDDWEPLAPGLKTIEDATEIRRRFLLAYENAELAEDESRRRALMTFVVVGGGPTGVELAGAFPAIAQRALKNDFRKINTADTRVILLEGGDRILPGFPPELSQRAAKDLNDLGVEVRTKSIVTKIEDDAVYVGSEKIDACTTFWAAGNAASPLGKMLGAPVDRAGRVKVERDLSVPGCKDVFVVGDLAYFEQDGRLVPGVAPAAMQQGRHAARNIRKRLRGDETKPFHYFNKGDLATIGRSRAIADFGFLQIVGFPAWWLWLFLHIMYLVGFRNRLSVMLQWAYAYITYGRGVRLITSPHVDPESMSRQA
jgi:NADH dehydrogenase